MNTTSSNTEICALILCGGQGTRLRETVKDVPKPLAAVCGKPFLDILVRYLERSGIKDIILSTGYQSEKIERYYVENPPVKSKIMISRENLPLGTAGAVKQAAEKISGDDFLVLNGDSFCNVSLKEMLVFHGYRRALVTMAVSQMENVSEFGTVNIDNGANITGFKEKILSQGSGFVNAGIYIFNRSVLSLIPDKVKCSLEHDVFPKLRNSYAYITSEPFIDIGTKERYNKACEIFSQRGYI